ncbi:MAG: hypothetical protein M1827_000159 [Pycnora praestabilis]|nr:MAG: hypothetical protein M1827_000159 [Pycnora praestabilis]
MSSSLPESSFTFIPQGAAIQEFRVAGHNLVQGFPKAELYKTHNGPYYGETIGRTTNRISGAKTKLNEKEVHLASNNGQNSLHGGAEGWGKKTFDGPKPINRNGKEGVMFSYHSPDGDEGYPGAVDLKVWYTAGIEHGKTVLEIEYEAEMVGEEDGVEETAIGVTNHSYFNIGDGPSIEGTEITLATNLYQPCDEGGIPKGGIEPYPGIEAKKTFTLGAKEPDPDDCFILNDEPSSIPVDTRSLPLKTLVTAYHPGTKLHLEVESTEPAFQFYTGRNIDVPAVAGLPARGPRTGFCVEPSRYVNALNVPEYRSMAILKRGRPFGSRVIYRGWKD